MKLKQQSQHAGENARLHWAPRLQKDIAKARKESDGIERRLANGDFISNAPAEVVAKDRARVRELAERVDRLGAALETLREIA